MISGKILKEKGFTLIELIIVIAILGILSAIAIPRFGNYSERAKKQVCETNRRTLFELYNIHYALESKISLADYISHNSDEIKDFICPSGGSFTVEGQGSDARLICSIHNDDVVTDPEPNPDFGIIPGTLGLKVTKIVAEKGEVTYLQRGETVYCDGIYYVGRHTGGNPFSSHNNIIEINTEKEAKNITDWKNSCSLGDFESKYGKVNQGDMFYYNNKYYVLEESNPDWMQLPGNQFPSYTYPWIMLGGQ